MYIVLTAAFLGLVASASPPHLMAQSYIKHYHPHNFSVAGSYDEQVECLAINLYHEARGQDEQGMYAAADVVINRMFSNRFPDGACGVVKQSPHYVDWSGTRTPVLNRCQFSWYCDGKSDSTHNSESWQYSLDMAHRALSSRIVYNTRKDSTLGAMWYHSGQELPYWADDMTLTVRIGEHRFYK